MTTRSQRRLKVKLHMIFDPGQVDLKQGGELKHELKMNCDRDYELASMDKEMAMVELSATPRQVKV